MNRLRVLLHHPEPVITAELRPTIERMSEAARRLVGEAHAVLDSRDPEAKLALARDDDEMD